MQVKVGTAPNIPPTSHSIHQTAPTPPTSKAPQCVHVSSWPIPKTKTQLIVPAGIFPIPKKSNTPFSQWMIHQGLHFVRQGRKSGGVSGRTPRGLLVSGSLTPQVHHALLAVWEKIEQINPWGLPCPLLPLLHSSRSSRQGRVFP